MLSLQNSLEEYMTRCNEHLEIKLTEQNGILGNELQLPMSPGCMKKVGKMVEQSCFLFLLALIFFF